MRPRYSSFTAFESKSKKTLRLASCPWASGFPIGAVVGAVGCVWPPGAMGCVGAVMPDDLSVTVASVLAGSLLAQAAARMASAAYRAIFLIAISLLMAN